MNRSDFPDFAVPASTLAEPVLSRRKMLVGLLSAAERVRVSGLPQIDETWTIREMMMAGYTPTMLVLWLELVLGEVPDGNLFHPHVTIAEMTIDLVSAGHKCLYTPR